MPYATPEDDQNASPHHEDQRIVEPSRDAWRIVSVYIAASLFWVLFSDLILNSLDVAPPVYQAIQYVKGGLFILVSGSIFYLILQHKLQRIRLSDETILRENAKLARTVNNLKIIELSLRRQQAEQVGLSENLRMEKQKLHRLAYEDPMTGLPNRARLLEDGTGLIEASKVRSHQLACIHLDVDNFKQINETLGMSAADAFLVDLAGMLKSYDHPGIRTYRLNGDEFALVFTHALDRSRIAAAIDQIFECFSKPWRLDGHSLFITVSAGIAVYPDHGESMTQLMQSANTALSHAKVKGCKSWMFFDSWMHESSWKNVRLYNDLQQAINHGQFQLHYQPLVDLVTDSIIGLEALIRWPDQTGGFYPPMEFIPFSESTGQIAAISDWVVREVHAQRQIWLSQGVRLVDISINLSGNLLSDGQVIPLFERLARQSSRTWQGIEIEITETAAVSNFEQTIAVLGRLKELGFSIALDDFGTGYSSLTYLRKLPIDRIKIDRSFLRDIVGDSNQQTIYQTIVTLAHQMGLEVVAEGVETAEQLLMLKTIGCDLAQGYYLSRPLPAADIRLLLEKSPGPRIVPFPGGLAAGPADRAFSTRKR